MEASAERGELARGVEPPETLELANSSGGMPRYRFHVQCGDSYQDRRGETFADDQTAALEAVRILGEVLRDEPELCFRSGSLELSVTTDAHLSLFTLTLVATRAAAFRGGQAH